MSDNPTASTIRCTVMTAKRCFVGIGVVAAVAGLWWPPSSALAQPKPSEISQVPTGDLAKMIDGNPDIGFVLTANFDGSINLYATENGEFAEEPVAIPRERLGESTLFIQVFEESPGTITIYINGMWVTIQN